LVKLVTLPITSLEKFWTPVTTEAANAEPGSWGSDIPVPVGKCEVVETGFGLADVTLPR
jgi:hypothetical protein